MRALYELRLSDTGSGAARPNGSLGEKTSLRVPCVGKSRGMLLSRLAGVSEAYLRPAQSFELTDIGRTEPWSNALCANERKEVMPRL